MYRQNVVVVIRIEPVKGFARCPGTPPFAYALQLDEPLGTGPMGRWLLSACDSHFLGVKV